MVWLQQNHWNAIESNGAPENNYYHPFVLEKLQSKTVSQHESGSHNLLSLFLLQIVRLVKTTLSGWRLNILVLAKVLCFFLQNFLGNNSCSHFTTKQTHHVLHLTFTTKLEKDIWHLQIKVYRNLPNRNLKPAKMTPI